MSFVLPNLRTSIDIHVCIQCLTSNFLDYKAQHVGAVAVYDCAWQVGLYLFQLIMNGKQWKTYSQCQAQMSGVLPGGYPVEYINYFIILARVN